MQIKTLVDLMKLLTRVSFEKMCLEILYVKISSQEYNTSVSDLVNRVYSKKLNYFISNVGGGGGGGGKTHVVCQLFTL